MKIKLMCILALGASLLGCVATPEQERGAPPIGQPGQILSATPDLAPYVRIELFSQSASPAELPIQLRTQFSVGQAQFDVSKADGLTVGRLHVQPDDCRDDPSAACERRFVINGRLQAFGVTLSCIVPVRNDTSVGYASQTLSGLCQSQYGRTYTIQMFPR